MTDALLRLAAALLAVAGVAVAGYLTYAHYADASVACIVGSGCETVQSSSYAEIAGVPVALVGVVGYGAILAALAWSDAIGRLVAAALALVGLLFSAYLLAVQLFVIDALCAWCVANDVVIAPALAVVTALRLRAE